MAWDIKHEALEKHFVEQIMQYISEHEKPQNFTRARAFLKESYKKKYGSALAKLKDPKGLLMAAAAKAVDKLPGMEIANEVNHQIHTMLTASFGSAFLRTKSMGGDEKPYNYLADLYGKVLSSQATHEERMLFAKWFTYIAMTTATVGADGGAGAHVASAAMPHIQTGATVAGQLAGKVIEKTIDKVTDKLVDKGIEIAEEEFVDVLSDAEADKDEGLKQKAQNGAKIGPVAWAIYLSAEPRNAKGPTSTVENCRLALRAILGMPYHSTSYLKEGQGVYVKHGDKNNPIVTPDDVCEMLGDAKGTNTMIDPAVPTKDNFHKIASFCDLGKVVPTYEPGQAYGKDVQLVKKHIINLQYILVGLELEKCLKEPFTLV